MRTTVVNNESQFDYQLTFHQGGEVFHWKFPMPILILYRVFREWKEGLAGEF